MKRFLKKIINEKKLELVESSEEISNSYLNKSSSNLESAKILIEKNKFEEAVYLIYYSMYNLLMALFYKIGIKSENHSVSIFLLKKLFDIDNSDIHYAKIERIDKQYYVGFSLNFKEVYDSLKSAERFNSYLGDFISRMNMKKIEFYRKKFKEDLLI